MTVDQIINLIYDEDSKDNVPVVLRGEGRLQLIGERLGWTVQFKVEYKKQQLITLNTYDYSDAADRVLKYYDNYLRIIKLLNDVDVSLIMKIDNIDKSKT